MVALQRLIGFTRLLEEQGYAVKAVSTITLTTEAPAEVYEALGVAPGTPIHAVDRLFVASGRPALLAINYIPASLFFDPPTERQLDQSPFDMRDLLEGGPVDHALVELVPTRASKGIAERLGLKRGEAYLLLKELHLSEAGRVLGFSLIHVNDHFVRFRLHRGGDGG